MAAVARGDMAAFGNLIERHQEKVRSLAYRLCGRWDVADDLAQESFLRVLRSAASYRGNAGFTTWLYRIVFNLCVDWRRRRQPISLAEADPDEPRGAFTGDALIRAEACEAIQRAVRELPERQQVALVLHRFQGLNIAEISETTGWSVSAVESLLVRAYSDLRQRLRSWAET